MVGNSKMATCISAAPASTSEFTATLPDADRRKLAANHAAKDETRLCSRPTRRFDVNEFSGGLYI